MDPVRVIFLGGLGRSGTTLLERVLGELPGVLALGEIVHLWARDVRDDERCGCGAHFSRCEFWEAVGQEAFGGWHQVDVPGLESLAAEVDRTRHLPRQALGRLNLGTVRRVDEYVSYYWRVYAAAAQVSGAKVVIDSSKHASLAYCLDAEPRIDLRVVHVVRDSRAVAHSWTKRIERPETDGHDEMARFSPLKSAALWNAHNLAFGLLARRRGVPVRRIRYEDFVAAPEQQLREIAEFAGVPLPEGPPEFLSGRRVELGPGHSAAGNPMRFTTGGIDLRPDEKWRSSMPSRQRRLVTALTAPLLAAYDYPVRS